jgi:hypothetical protein
MARGPIHGRHVALVLAGILLLAGCGSTVAGVSGSGVLTPSNGSAQDPASGGLGGSGPATSALAGGGTALSSGSGGSTAVGSAVTPSGPVGPGLGSTSAPSGNGPGVTATTINIGAVYCSDCNAANAAVGATGQNTGNPQAEMNAVIDYVNAHGGVAHRKLVPIWFSGSVSQSASTSEQEECAYFEQDHHVFIIQTLGSQILNACVAKSHVLGLDAGVVAESTSAVDKQFPASIDLTGPNIDGLMAVTIDGLAQQGYFGKGKVGIITWDNPYYTWSVTHGANPALARLGLRGVPVEYVTAPQQYSDVGASSASVSSAVLKFRGQGIDHVILFDGYVGVNAGGLLCLEWMQQANQQQYYPIYGLNSTCGFSSNTSLYPAQQLVGSVGVGWIPIFDETPTDYPPSKLPPLGRLCLQIMKQAGQSAAPGTNQEYGQLAACDRIFFVQQVLGKIRGPINQATALAAINAAGASFGPGETFGTYLSASQHAGLSKVANIAYVPSCTCYRYTSAPYNIRRRTA